MAAPLRARTPTKNPRPEEYDYEWPELDDSSWGRLTMEWRKTDGGIVDAELLRPRNWVASSHLEIGSIFKVFSTELELNGIAEITAVSPCPSLCTGDGEVVTGRFVTRRADETVRMTFDTGDTLEGSKSHPIWSPAIRPRRLDYGQVCRGPKRISPTLQYRSTRRTCL
ncbi:hypothetical protein [Schlesneria paludicola]|uniref:hypothetical protein n=1 Tax=Schlesneria paludicola TaxID=360056 RepID=UPI00029AF7E2|nr:hypothetical protein [Schlesneria paludicola]